MGVGKEGPTNAPAEEAKLGLQKVTIKKWIAPKDFGFLILPNGQEAFCHSSELCSHLRPKSGQTPILSDAVYIGQIESGPKGPRIKDLKCRECIKPPVWELKPAGEPVLGVYELAPVCTNRPNEPFFKSTIPFEKVFAANEPFRKAKEKNKIWKGPLNDAFFHEFGEPENIRAQGGNYIILTYPAPFGEKEISTYQAFETGRWKISPLNDWRKVGTLIEKDFSFDDIPNAKIGISVAYHGDDTHYSHPRVNERFALIPAEDQREIIDYLKSKILPPEELANRRFQRFLENNQRPGSQLSVLRNELIELQSPGEVYFSSESRKVQIQVPTSDDEMRGPGTYNSTMAIWYVVVGARKREHPHWTGDYSGGEKFRLFSIENGMHETTKVKILEDPMAAKDNLISQKKAELQDIFSYAKKFDLPPADSRLYVVSPEIWRERYSKQWDTLQKNFEGEWQKQEREILSKRQADWDIYESVGAELRNVRNEASAVKLRTKKYRIYFDSETLKEPRLGDIGGDDVDSLRECIADYRKYIQNVNELIAEELQKRGEVELTDSGLRETMEHQAPPAQWYLDGVDPTILENTFGRKTGEGFGKKVAGESFYLPGSRPIVGIAFAPQGAQRYVTHITTHGMLPLDNSLPRNVRGRGDYVNLLAIVDNSEWQVCAIDYDNDEPYRYHLWNPEGRAHLNIYQGGETQFESSSWDNISGLGPTINDIISIHGIKTLPRQEKMTANTFPKVAQRGISHSTVGKDTQPAHQDTLPKSNNPQEEMQTTFSQLEKRDFRCIGCQYTNTLSKAAYRNYESGQKIQLCCSGCNKKGAVEKN